jgi:hypothetical protein
MAEGSIPSKGFMKVRIGKYPKGGGPRPVRVEVDSDDTYSLDYTLALVIVPALKRFKKDAKGTLWGCFLPSEHMDNSVRMTKGQRNRNERAARKQQDEVLDKMIHAFELVIDDKALNRNLPEIQEGLELFAKYYRHLWW